MKRGLTTLLIAVYLGVLTAGLVSHALKFHSHSHPVMYFLVWDMYGGWCAFETRQHVIAEGVSGEYYEVLPPPWESYKPFGVLDRQHYDAKVQYVPQMAALVLQHTEHEPIRRIVVIEEAWSKKYNLPDHLWTSRHDDPKQPTSYFHVRAVADAEGHVSHRTLQWSQRLSTRCLADNPRLMSDISRGRTFIAFDPERPEGHQVIPAGYNPGY